MTQSVMEESQRRALTPGKELHGCVKKRPYGYGWGLVVADYQAIYPNRRIVGYIYLIKRKRPSKMHQMG